MSDWIIPYFSFNGNCAEAVEFYQKALGGESQVMRYSDAPPNPNFQIPEQAKNLVIHAELRKDGHVIRMSDTFPGSPFSLGNNISLALEFQSKEDTFAMFTALSEGGDVKMEPQATFFSPCYANFTDKFGIIWQLRTIPTMA